MAEMRPGSSLSQIDICLSFSVNDRMKQHEVAPEPVLLILADISGYTRYMTANARTLAHSQTIITELVQSIVQQVELPLEIAKLEGDAVFMFCRKNNTAQPWPEVKRMIGTKLLRFFQLFQQRVHELSGSATCSCSACAHIENLRLKIIAHSGEALFHRVLHFDELAGVDVIIAHRLLKNSVNADQYLLLTSAAREDIEFVDEIPLKSSAESYEDIGQVRTWLYLPDQPAAANGTVEPPFGVRFKRAWTLFQKLWFGAMRAGRKPAFRHLSSDATAFGRSGFALLSLLVTPLFFPAGAIVAMMHALKAPQHSHAQDEAPHEPAADGSCCAKKQ
jgi:hypothetical protein